MRIGRMHWRFGGATLQGLQDVLDACPSDSTVVIGHDLNQDVHAEVDTFEGMLHYRQLLLRTGLEVSPPQGATWVARGSESCIDFFLFRTPQSEVSFWLREDYRISLPSDHNAIGMRIQLAAGRTPSGGGPGRPAAASGWWIRSLCGSSYRVNLRGIRRPLRQRLGHRG